MAELNRYEQQRVDRVAELEEKRRRGEFVSESQLEGAREIAANMQRNAEARAERNAEWQASLARGTAARQAEKDKAMLIAQERYKRLAAATFPGTSQQFEAAWPELLKQWQVRNTADDADSYRFTRSAEFDGMF